MVIEFALSGSSDHRGLRLRSPAGEFPIDAPRLEAAIGNWNAWRRTGSGELPEIARSLSELLLPPRLAQAIQGTAARAIQARGKLRLIVEATEAEFAEVPWELLELRRESALDPIDGALALQPSTQFVRRTGRSRSAALPLPKARALVVVADPGSARFARLSHVDAEVRAVGAALARSDGRVEIRSLLDATPASLEWALKEYRPQIVHFAGHAEARLTGGVLVLQGTTTGSETPLSADVLRQWLLDSECRLVVLDACDTAGRRGAVAEALASGGVPAVVAMQAPLNDVWGPQFARSFYGALREGAGIAEAIASGRQSLFGTTHGWAASVLLTDAPDEALFATTPTTEPAPPNNLPSEVRVFVGRDREIRAVERWLERGELVTIAGPAGHGKSRLACHVAWSVRRAYPDGVWFVDCGAAESREGLYASVAEALSLPSDGGSVVEAVRGALGERRSLLVLDGAESLTANASAAVLELTELKNLAVLASGRSRLGIPGERVVSIGPLEAEAVDLFLGAAGLDGSELSSVQREHVEVICALLEGVPLAIVLAAARLKILDLRQLRTLLEESPLRTLDGETGSLSEAIRRSLDLVPERDRRLIGRLAAFSRGFRWEDAVAVCGDDRFDLLEGLTRLTESSLLQAVDGAYGRRFRLLDTVREAVAGSRLDADDDRSRSEARRRHADHFLARARAALAKTDSGRPEEEEEVLWPNLGNFRAAVAFATAAGSDEMLCGFADALARSYFEAGLAADFEALSRAAFVAAERLGDDRLRSQLLGLEGAFAYQRGDPKRGYQAWVSRAALCRSIDDRAGAADAEIDLAVQAFADGSPEEGARRLIEAERALCDDAAGTARATIAVIRARTLATMGDAAEAERWAERAQSLLQGSSDADAALYVRINLGRVWEMCADVERAEAAFVGVLRDASRRSRKGQTAIAALELSRRQETRGRNETALLCAMVAHRLLERSGSRHRREAEARLSALERLAPTVGHPGASTSQLIEEILRRTA